MAQARNERYEALILALDTAANAVREIFEWSDAPPPLDRYTVMRIMAAVEELEEIQADLEGRADEVYRQAQEDQVHAELDAIERTP